MSQKPSNLILFVIPSLKTGGAERVVSHMANYWVAQGKKVSILTFDKDYTPAYDLLPTIQLYPTDIYKPSKNKLDALKNSLRRLKILRGYFRQLQPEVVISFTDDANVLCSLAAVGKRRFRLILADRAHPLLFNPRPIWHFLKKMTYRLADVLVVQTAAVAQYYRGFNVPIAVIPNPLPKPQKSVESYENQRIIAVGRLVKEKNFELLIRAFARVATPNWEVHILGEGNERAHLTQLIAEKGLEKQVLLRGRSDTVLSDLTHASVYVLSSRTEGFPNALIEAMSVGLACISTDCPSGPSEIIETGQNGLLVPNDDETALAFALEKLINSVEIRKKMGKNAHLITEKLSLPKIMAAWESHFLP
jgi:GalNAc-alpha-(1->4)-GalNAc-alpha-(1->3)-diNAcBac-PP-undecaprenol alpha-1,4-N-acetyl-D-galactosaminyltransferase